jgi:hypothetical protein
VTKKDDEELSADEHKNLTNHCKALAGLIGRLRRDDQGAWTKIIPDLYAIEMRLRVVLRGEFERQTPELPGRDEDEEIEDDDPPTKKGRKKTASKKK